MRGPSEGPRQWARARGRSLRARGTRAKGQSRTTAANKERGEGQREGGGRKPHSVCQCDERRGRGHEQGGQVGEQTALKATGKRHHGVKKNWDKVKHRSAEQTGKKVVALLKPLSHGLLRWIRRIVDDVARTVDDSDGVVHRSTASL